MASGGSSTWMEWSRPCHGSRSDGTPPMFIAHMQKDSVPGLNALELYAELTRHGISSVLHIYEGENHGFGLAANHPWGRDLLEWLALRK